jgi:gliding motility-associated-like protein
MIVTCWPDGALSYASEEVCAQILKDAPVMTKVSVGLTSDVSGRDTIMWSPPTELDTKNFLPPYQYKLYWSPGNTSPGSLIYTSSEFMGTDFSLWGDTIFIHENVNTTANANNYRVDFYSSNEFIDASSDASSLFITPVPNDNQLTIVMDSQVPWNNYNYLIYRYNEVISDFELIGETAETSYTDIGLNNNQEYCYKVISLGKYGDDESLDSLYNHSQEICAEPYDLTPPCPPVLSVDPDCDFVKDNLEWTNPNNTCADDVTGYNIYYTPIQGGEFELIATIDLADDTMYVFNEDGSLNSIAGCFAITALDSLNLWPDGEFHQNESEFSNIECADNCPFYFLPNIFTPNGDLVNDLYRPFPYHYIESIDLKIYNRWGGVIFETTDPEINWDGHTTSSGDVASDGVYYYVVKVNTIRLTGIVTEEFSGNIQLVNGKDLPNVE